MKTRRSIPRPIVRPRANDLESDRKLESLILHIAQTCERDPSCGATKLNKLLFLADFGAYRRSGKSLTGQDYRALELGPAPLRLMPVREGMLRKQWIAMREDDFHGWPQDRVIPLRRADLNAFTPDEIAHVGHLVAEFWGVSAADMTNLTHLFAGWLVAKRSEIIPYGLTFVGNRDLTPEERAHGRSLDKLVAQYVEQ